jgi:phage baseplate assembly protein W
MAIKLNNKLKAIKIAPIDVSEKAAVGIRLPFNKKRTFTLDYTTRDHAKSKLTNVLLTSPGERLNQPLFGVGLKNRLFEQQTELSEKSADLKSIVTPQVQQYIPEIEIKNIFLKDGGIAGHKLFVTVNYSLLNNDEEDSVTLSFTNENFND